MSPKVGNGTLGKCTLQCTQFVQKLELHIMSKVAIRKTFIHLELFLKSHINHLRFKIKRNHESHEYQIES